MLNSLTANNIAPNVYFGKKKEGNSKTSYPHTIRVMHRRIEKAFEIQFQL